MWNTCCTCTLWHACTCWLLFDSVHSNLMTIREKLGKKRTENEFRCKVSEWGSGWYPVQVVFQDPAPRLQVLVGRRHPFPPGQLVFSFQLLDSVHAVQTHGEANTGQHTHTHTHTTSNISGFGSNESAPPCFQHLHSLYCCWAKRNADRREDDQFWGQSEPETLAA